MIIRIVPNPVAERLCFRDSASDIPAFIRDNLSLLPGPVRTENGISGIMLTPVKSALQRGVFDQEIIDEELPSNVYGNDAWRRQEVMRWLHRITFFCWRPFFW